MSISIGTILVMRIQSPNKDKTHINTLSLHSLPHLEILMVHVIHQLAPNLNMHLLPFLIIGDLHSISAFVT